MDKQNKPSLAEVKNQGRKLAKSIQENDENNSKEVQDMASNLIKYPSYTIKNLENSEEITKNYLHKRIELNSFMATVKYIGPLLHKKINEEIWIGVEWDDETRGKHNGTVEGFKYFETENLKNSGSLIKISKVNFGIDLMEALDFKYNFQNKYKENEVYNFMNNVVESELYVKAKNKKIEIELVGKNEALKVCSDYKKIITIDLSFSYLSNINLKTDLSDLLPRIKELNLTRSLISKWSDFAFLLTKLKSLENLNFTENRLTYDEEFFRLFNYLEKDIVNEEIIKKFGEKQTLANSLNLTNLILNQNGVNISDLMNISFLCKKLENLYLFDNNINDNQLPDFNSTKINLISKEKFKENFINLKALILEKNKINNLQKVLDFFNHEQLLFLNLNQNNIKYIFNADDLGNLLENNLLPKEELEKYFASLKNLHIDFNAIFDYKILFKHLNSLTTLENLNVLNNGFVRQKEIGLDNGKINVIGRLNNLRNLNNTIINRADVRDSQLLYLKNSVKEYFEELKEPFNRNVFEEFMKENHPNYFFLFKKYYDPVEDFMIGMESTKTNTMKGNMNEFTFIHKKKVIKRKFPKTITFANLKNLLTKLFKINGNIYFRILNETLDANDFEDHHFNNVKFGEDLVFDISDESKSLEDYNITTKDKILLI